MNHNSLDHLTLLESIYKVPRSLSFVEMERVATIHPKFHEGLIHLN